MKLNKFLVIITPFALLVLLELFFFYPRLIFFSFIFGVLFIFYTIQNFIKISVYGKKFLNYTILPILFFIASISFSLVAISQIFVQLIFFLCVVFVYLYLRQVYYLMLSSSKEYFFENTSSYGGFLIVFFFSSTIYGLQSFLNIPIWILILFFVPILGIIFYQVFWSNKLDFSKSSIFIVLLCILLSEIAWSIAFLPFRHYVIGFILAICYYILIGLTRFYLNNKLDSKTIKLYLYFGFFSLILMFLTSRWM